MADMRGLVIDKPEWPSHQQYAMHGVPAGTGFSMTIADQMNNAVRRCRIGRIVLKHQPGGVTWIGQEPKKLRDVFRGWLS